MGWVGVGGCDGGRGIICVKENEMIIRLIEDVNIRREVQV